MKPSLDLTSITSLDEWVTRIRAERRSDAALRKDLEKSAQLDRPVTLGLSGPLVEAIMRHQPQLVPLSRWGGELGWPSQKRLKTWQKMMQHAGVSEPAASHGMLIRFEVVGSEWVPYPDVPASWACASIDSFGQYVLPSVPPDVLTDEYERALAWRSANADALTKQLSPLLSSCVQRYYARYHPYSGGQHIDVALLLPSVSDPPISVTPTWRGEATLAAAVRLLFPDAIPQFSPDWLGGQRLDVFVPSRKLAFEYQGEQHYTPVGFFGGDATFLDTRRRDERKKQACSHAGATLIEWPHWREVTVETVLRELAAHGITPDSVQADP